MSIRVQRERSGSDRRRRNGMANVLDGLSADQIHNLYQESSHLVASITLSQMSTEEDHPSSPAPTYHDIDETFEDMSIADDADEEQIVNNYASSNRFRQRRNAVCYHDATQVFMETIVHKVESARGSRQS